jgi:pyrroline-5-carboxylate reductase
MIEACILLGLSRDVATDLIIQTMLGSAKMLRDTGKHPVELREMVTSPGGTTIEAIRRLGGSGCTGRVPERDRRREDAQLKSCPRRRRRRTT